jgi:primosomal protein N' (replication factor Y) (superfamily II helicase)
VKDRYRMQLILKATARASLSEALQVAPLQPGGPVTLDRDPIQFGT